MARWPLFAGPGLFTHDVTRRFADGLARKFAYWLVFFARRAIEKVRKPAAAGAGRRGGGDHGWYRRRAAGRWRKAPALASLRRTRRLHFASRNIGGRAWNLASATDYGQRRLFARAAQHRLHRVEITAMARNDAIEFGKSLDLVDDDPAHLRGAFGSFLRQLEDAASEFVARAFEFALHFRGHLLHALDGFAKTLVCALEEGLGLADGLLVDRTHRFGRALAFFFGVLTDALVLLADGASAFRARFRNEPGNLACARRSGLEGLVEETGESRQALFEILGPDVEGGDQGIELDAPLVDAVLGTLIAVIDDLDRFDQVAAVNVELPRQLPEVADHLGRDVAEGRDVCLDAPGRIAGGRCNIIHRGDEFGHAHHEGIFQGPHVLMSSAEHFLKHDVGFAQALEEGGRVGPQHCVRLEHFLHGRSRRVLRLRDRLLCRLVEFIDRAGDDVGGSFARGVDHARNFAAVVHHRAREREALFLDRLDGLIGGCRDVAGKLRALVGDGSKHAAALFGQNGGHFIGAAADRSGDLLGLADKAACNFLADAHQSTLGIARAGADRLGGGEGKLHKRALALRRIDLDHLAQLLQPRIEGVGGSLAARLDLAGD